MVAIVRAAWPVVRRDERTLYMDKGNSVGDRWTRASRIGNRSQRANDFFLGCGDDGGEKGRHSQSASIFFVSARMTSRSTSSAFTSLPR